MRIASRAEPSRIVEGHQEMENVEDLGSIITRGIINNGVKTKIAMTKAVITKKRILVTCKSELEMENKPVNTQRSGAETWTFRKSEQKNLETFKM